MDKKRGRLHGYLGRGRVGRSGKPKKAILRRTDELTDRKVAFREAYA